MAKAYKVNNLNGLLDLIPENMGWNYLNANLVPNQSSSQTKHCIVKINRGLPFSLAHRQDTSGYGPTVNDFVEGVEAPWERVEIEEDEPVWVQSAKVNISGFLDVYRMEYVQLLFGAYHLSGDVNRHYQISVVGFDDGNKFKKVELHEGLGISDGSKKLFEVLRKKFGANFVQEYDSFKMR